MSAKQGAALPPKGQIIKSATVFCFGDPPVGIPHASFNIELWLDLDLFEDDDKKRKVLDEFRAVLEKAYEEFITGDSVHVIFDYEIQLAALAEEKLLGHPLAKHLRMSEDAD